MKKSPVFKQYEDEVSSEPVYVNGSAISVQESCFSLKSQLSSTSVEPARITESDSKSLLPLETDRFGFIKQAASDDIVR